MTEDEYSDTIAVAALDFGTTYSGWAMSYKKGTESSKIYTKNWNSGEHISYKTPTALLIRSDGETLDSFGCDAENRYISLEKEKKHADYYFFSKFKMELYNQNDITRNMDIKALNGKGLPAMRIFTMAIRFLKDDLVSDVRGSLNQDNFHWTLTVPSIWSEKAKKFMREAAIKAGINSNKLTIVLEPEAAAAFGQHVPVQKCFGGHLASLVPGSKYAIIDCGGGTTDICCHEKMKDGTLVENVGGAGLDVGGTDVDKAFIAFLGIVVGPAVWKQFSRDNKGTFLHLLRDFQDKKREIKPSGSDPITFALPDELVDILKKKTKGSLKDAVSVCKFKDDIKLLRGNKIRISADVFRKEVYGDVSLRLETLLKDRPV